LTKKQTKKLTGYMSQQNELHEPVHRREEENGFFRFFVFFISKQNGKKWIFCTLEYAGCSSVCDLMGRNVKKE
jgi:hypothetical protein